MNILDIFPCEIWCEILDYLCEIIYFREVCLEMCKMIDTCEYINWKFRGIMINNSRILSIITNIKKVAIRDESVICWDNMKNIEELHCGYYKKKINKDEIPKEILNFDIENVGIDDQNLIYWNDMKTIERLYCNYGKKINRNENPENISNYKIEYMKIAREIAGELKFNRYNKKSVLYWRQKYNIDLKLPYQLVELHCTNTFIQDLSGLKVLKKLVCDSCRYIIDDKLPISLENLSCVMTNVTNLSHLINLKTLECAICHNIDDSKFPKSLEKLICEFSENIKNINYLKSLEYLNCNNCNEIKDHGLPPNLKGLFCRETKLKDLNHLKLLKVLNCENCKYIDVEKLPQGLRRLDCMSCYHFRDLKRSMKLKNLNCNNCTYLTHDNLPNGLFTLNCCLTKITNFGKFYKLKHLTMDKIVKEKYGNTIAKNVKIKIIDNNFDPDNVEIHNHFELDSDSDSE